MEGEYLIDKNILEVLLEQDNKESCPDLLKLVEEILKRHERDAYRLSALQYIKQLPNPFKG